MKKSTTIFFIVIIAILIITIVFQILSYYQLKNLKNQIFKTSAPVITPSTEKPTETSIEEPETEPTQTLADTRTIWQYRTDDYLYELKNDIQYEISKHDQQIIKTNLKTNEKEIIVASLKNEIPELKERPAYLLTGFSSPQNSNVVFFRRTLFGTDAPSDIIFSYNLNDNKFQKMKINQLVEDCWDTAGRYRLSPDQTKFYFIPYSKNITGDENIMYLIDLIEDSYTQIIKLSSQETFNAGYFTHWGCWLDCPAYFDIEWIDNNTIKYAVFDQTKKPTISEEPFILDRFHFVYTDEYQKSIFIEDREFKFK